MLQKCFWKKKSDEKVWSFAKLSDCQKPTSTQAYYYTRGVNLGKI